MTEDAHGALLPTDIAERLTAIAANTKILTWDEAKALSDDEVEVGIRTAAALGNLTRSLQISCGMALLTRKTLLSRREWAEFLGSMVATTGKSRRTLQRWVAEAEKVREERAREVAAARSELPPLVAPEPEGTTPVSLTKALEDPEGLLPAIGETLQREGVNPWPEADPDEGIRVSFDKRAGAIPARPADREAAKPVPEPEPEPPSPEEVAALVDVATDLLIAALLDRRDGHFDNWRKLAVHCAVRLAEEETE